jgi:NAD(P)-dependent dehydrogenase (short-subunit alcohol dehydrogenase family)
VPYDVQDWEQVAALPTRAEEAFGRLDAVFANAGVFTPTSPALPACQRLSFAVASGCGEVRFGPQRLVGA